MPAGFIVGAMKNWLFLLGFGFLATHELDAVTQSEWRLLYVLRGLPDELAESAFVALHVPLFTLIVGLCHHPRSSLREGSRAALAAFLVIHVGLHLRLRAYPLYSFHDGLSQALIFGGGVCGLLYLLLCWRERRRA